jgi:UDP-N-acetylglucosamine--N-acetylmuramyl-(pentapeptide) pyrophosphoryl-undecaprenol N-acetylglucosamine transferase
MSALLVASTGGHLKELHHLRARFGGVGGPVRWVTFDTPQSRSLLKGEEVDFVPFVGGRDPVNVARNLATARRTLRGFRPDAVLSTGSAVALPYFALARARRLPCHFIESAARIEGPSLTGRLMTAIPGVDLYTQYRSWSGRRWGYGGSVFDSFAAETSPTRESPRLSRVVVSFGTYRGYDFSRLVQRLLEILPAEAEVLWQTGDTDVSRFEVRGHYAIPEHELTEAMREADAVVAHAGVGTALAAFEVGKCPLLVPRRFALGEHVDDHQVQVCRDLVGRGLAVSVDADQLGPEHLVEAAGRSVAVRAQAPIFDVSSPLDGSDRLSRGGELAGASSGR